ncbi:MAG: hypothetical protein PHP66_06395 [Syntrophales bacterium]|jgi:hypothetical protein|nr:hypothetical protein [Syntrophales bacterium]
MIEMIRLRLAHGLFHRAPAVSAQWGQKIDGEAMVCQEAKLFYGFLGGYDQPVASLKNVTKEGDIPDPFPLTGTNDFPILRSRNRKFLSNKNGKPLKSADPYYRLIAGEY